MFETVAVGSAAIGVSVVAAVVLVRVLATRALEAQIAQLEAQVISWQSMHHHEVACMDKRLADLEECAARAEEETRLVSHQLERISRVLRRADGDDVRDLGLHPGFPVGVEEAERDGQARSGTTVDREAALTAGGSW